MDNKRYFDVPTQVVFYDGNCWKSGIAYGGEIICACCGGVIEIDEIYEFAPAEMAQPIFAYKNWCDITEDIVGGEMPAEWYEVYDPINEAEETQAEAWYFENIQDKER